MFQERDWVKRVPRVFYRPIPKGCRLVMCLGDKFMFMEGVPVFQNVSYMLEFVTYKPDFVTLPNPTPRAILESSYFTVELYHFYHNTFNI